MRFLQIHIMLDLDHHLGTWVLTGTVPEWSKWTWPTHTRSVVGVRMNCQVPLFCWRAGVKFGEVPTSLTSWMQPLLPSTHGARIGRKHPLSRVLTKKNLRLHRPLYEWASLIPLPLKVFLTMSPLNLVPILRLQQFPRGLGKGSDAALVGGWLQTTMAEMDENMIPATCWSCSVLVVNGTCIFMFNITYSFSK